MPILRAQVRVPATTGVTADDVINTWHFTTTAINETNVNAIQTALVDFYEDWDAYKSSDFTWASARVKWYNMDDPEPRVPYDDEVLGLSTPPGTGIFPHEVALCLSFKAEYVSGASAARRRGRIYCGPFNQMTILSGGRPPAALVTALVAAGGALLTTSNAASDWAWIVYSPTSDEGYPVTEGWVDNEFDIQRRRGPKATARTSF